MLELIDFSKTYHGVPAVRNISFTAVPGRVLGLLGPNGSGKSTTVRMLVGLLTPSGGAVRWKGLSIQEQLSAYLQIVGYVPEEQHLYDYLSASEYLELIGGLRGIAASTLEHRVNRYLELLTLDTNVHAPLSSFSKGMRQKVLIAAALLHDPEIVVLDEPSSGLDDASTLILRSLVSALAARDRIVIYCSHVLDEVEHLCHDVIILHKGRVVAHDSATRLRELARAASLEQVFTALAVDQDVDRIGRELAQVPLS